MNWTLIFQYLIDKLPDIIAAVAAAYSVIKVQKLHVLVNSRLSQLLISTDKASHAEGKAEGLAQGQAEKSKKVRTKSIDHRI